MGDRLRLEAPKAPRWITTEAGQWAWVVDEEWRHSASQAMNVDVRRQLLEKAEDMRRHGAMTLV
ncbi:hypothetical protein [Candidatus Oscillochloris fontis]|uniref:hypothetical protein n=1 Tax=Candidatus Oscillochloris fontis TaxID=2496868 RepID=UPI00101C8E7A|nr:hypothetical protein [Candidatus Oscillochloris fontis]